MVIEKTNEKEVNEGSLSPKIKNLLVKQLAHELRNHNLYMTFASFYANRGLNKLAKYYELRANEEYLHHNWVKWYLNENGESCVYPAITEINEKFEDLIDPIQLTVDVEAETTEMIYSICEQATEEGDYITLAWLNGNDEKTGKLCLEQLEEESLSTAVLDIARMPDGWLTKETAIWELYNH